MKNKFVITKNNHKIISAYYENDILYTLDAEPESTNNILGNIYVGKVKNIVKNINAAFVDIGYSLDCYYSLEENKNHIFLNKKNTSKICIGDEILIQVTKEAMKTKGPVVTCNIDIAGKYSVLTFNKTKAGISNKIHDTFLRERLRALANLYITEHFGIIIRTNASNTDIDTVELEIQQLIQQYNRIYEISKHRKCYQLIYKTPEGYLQKIRDAYQPIHEIITDNEEIYNEIQEYISQSANEFIHNGSNNGDSATLLRFYQDPLLSLTSLYSIETQIYKALEKKVWLKSGASIVIEPTETLVAIDVNTSKFVGNKKMKDTFLAINIEAGKEIARQIRLRNLSGIIIVDFIDMDSVEHRNILLYEFERALAKDPIKTTLVDITKLGLVEVTRKKMKKPLYQQIYGNHA